MELEDDASPWLELEREAFLGKEKLGQDDSAHLEFAFLVKQKPGDDSPPCLEHASLEKEQLEDDSACLEVRGAFL